MTESSVRVVAAGSGLVAARAAAEMPLPTTMAPIIKATMAITMRTSMSVKPLLEAR